MKRLVLTLGVLFLLGSPAARAQNAAPRARPTDQAPSLGDSLTGDAKRDYAAAQILLDNHDYGGAYAKLEEAYEAAKDPRLLLDMAICAREIHDYARMQRLLGRYKREGSAMISPAEAAQVEAALTAIRELVGSVRLTVSEAGASVAVDGDAAGTSPLPEDIVLNLGRHQVTVGKDGFAPVTESVDVRGGAETPVTVTLAPLTGTAAPPAHLVVVVDPAAVVTVDGREVAHGRLDAAFSPGPHDVRADEPGKVPYKAQVDLRAGETRTLELTLEDEKHQKPWWPWAVGGAVVAAGLVTGGYFLFRPTQESSGPAPSETLGSLQLGARRAR